MIKIYFLKTLFLHKESKQNALNACPPKKEEGQHNILQDYWTKHVLLTNLHDKLMCSLF